MNNHLGFGIGLMLIALGSLTVGYYIGHSIISNKMSNDLVKYCYKVTDADTSSIPPQFRIFILNITQGYYTIYICKVN